MGISVGSSGSGVSAGAVSSQSQVSLLKKQQSQQEAVVGKLLQGVDQSATTAAQRAPEQTGQILNVKA